MIPVLLFLATTTVLGVLWSSRLAALRGWGERLAVGMTIGLVIQLWLPFFAAKILGGGIAFGPAIALFASAQAALLFTRSMRVRGEIPNWAALWQSLLARFRTGNFLENGFFFCALGAFIGWLYYTHSLRPTAAGLTSAGVSWEDQSGHAMYASSFLHSDNLETMEYPHFAGWPLAYPFLCNLLAATLARLGVTLSEAFWLSGWYAGMTFLLVAWVVIRDWVGTARRASFAVVLLLCTGGFGFVDFARGILGGTPWTQMLMQHDYANAWEFKLHYHNVLTAILLPMRSFLFGMPLALAALFLLWRSLELGAASARRELFLAGVLTGLTPLTNAHALIITGWCGLGLALLYLRYDDWRNWGRVALHYALPMLVLAVPQLLWTQHQLAVTNPFFRLAPGWMAEAKTLGEWLAYWLHNGGAWLPLGLVGWAAAPPRLKKLTAPFLALLVLGNLVAFQPLVYDNVKLFVFADVAIAALAVYFFGRLWQRSRKFILVILPLTALLTVSGVLSIWRELKLEWVIVDSEGVRFAELVRENSPPRAVFLTGSELTHPVPVLTGRPQVLGYQGWVTNLGVPLGERAGDVREMFEGGPTAASLFEKYHVRFVVIGPPERREFPKLDEPFIASHALKRWVSGPYALYEF